MRSAESMSVGDDVYVQFSDGHIKWGVWRGSDGGHMYVETGVHIPTTVPVPFVGTTVTVYDTTHRVIGQPDSDPPLPEVPPDLE